MYVLIGVSCLNNTEEESSIYKGYGWGKFFNDRYCHSSKLGITVNNTGISSQRRYYQRIYNNFLIIE